MPKNCERVSNDWRKAKVATKFLSDIHPSLRVTRCEHHYIFCIWREGAPAIIIAILHERMDLIARIKDRLV